MRNKILGINVRVTPAEKEKLSKTHIIADFLCRNICGGWGLEKMSKPQPMRNLQDFSACPTTEKGF